MHAHAMPHRTYVSRSMLMACTLPLLTSPMASAAQKNMCLPRGAAGGRQGQRRQAAAQGLPPALACSAGAARRLCVCRRRRHPPHGQRDRVWEAAVGQQVFVVHDHDARQANPDAHVGVGLQQGS